MSHTTGTREGNAEDKVELDSILFFNHTIMLLSRRRKEYIYFVFGAYYNAL